MNNVLFKDLTPGSSIHALIKDSEGLRYAEGSIVSIGQQRVDIPQATPGQFPVPMNLPSPKTVVDVTYCIEGKNYTDAVEVASYMFPTEKPGAVTLVATDKEPIVRELHATLKRAEDYLKSVQTEVPRNEKRVEDCKSLISELDTAYAEKHEIDTRIKKLEDSSMHTNELLSQILQKLEK